MECLLIDQLSTLPPFKGPATQISSQEDLEGPVMHAGSTPADGEALKLLGLTLQSVVFTLLLTEWDLDVVYDSWICTLEFS